MIRPDDSCLTPQQLLTVQRCADRLLREASALDVFPTPIDQIMDAAKLTVVDDAFLDEGVIKQFIRKAAQSVSGNIKSALSKVRAFLHMPELLVFIDKDMPAPSMPFIKLHEAGHGTLPHQNKLYSYIHDCDKTLDPDTTDLFEREANVFAAEALFQGSTFANEAHDHAFGIKVPIGLSTRYGASKYATFRRYVDTNPSACCVIVLEPVVKGLGNQFTAQIRRVIASKTFHVNFGTSAFGTVLSRAHLLGHMVPVDKPMTGCRNIKLQDRNGDRRSCTAEAFNTTHHIFVLIKAAGVAPSTIILPSSQSGASLRS